MQLAAILRRQIETGEITDRLPSITELARKYDVVPNTVQRALRVLKNEGLIVGRPGRGTFVIRNYAPPPVMLCASWPGGGTSVTCGFR